MQVVVCSLTVQLIQLLSTVSETKNTFRRKNLMTSFDFLTKL